LNFGDILIGGSADKALKTQIKDAIDTHIYQEIQGGGPRFRPTVVTPAPGDYLALRNGTLSTG
jgi:hypothetical protein